MQTAGSLGAAIAGSSVDDSTPAETPMENPADTTTPTPVDGGSTNATTQLKKETDN
jgi:hypothetical protein